MSNSTKRHTNIELKSFTTISICKVSSLILLILLFVFFSKYYYAKQYSLVNEEKKRIFTRSHYSCANHLHQHCFPEGSGLFSHLPLYTVFISENNFFKIRFKCNKHNITHCYTVFPWKLDYQYYHEVMQSSHLVNFTVT